MLGRDVFAALYVQLVDGYMTTAPVAPILTVFKVSTLSNTSLGYAKNTQN